MPKPIPPAPTAARTAALTAALAAALALAAAPAALAQPAGQSSAQSFGPARGPHPCFAEHDILSWRAPDDHTLYIRVLQGDVYKLTLSNTCSNLRYSDSRLVTRSHGAGEVCHGIDLDLQVASSSGLPETCLVDQVIPLTREQAAAIPKKWQP